VSARLSRATLAALPPAVRRPCYDFERVEPGIVHLGPGAFHRVHQAWYAEQWLATDRRWGIVGVSLRSAALREALAPQDNLYTLAIVDAPSSLEVIGSLRECVVAAESPGRAVGCIASPRARLLTLTVTEKGYCLGVDDHLDFAHPDILHDLEHPREPRSAIGLVVEGLRLRREQRLPALPVMSCDNLAGNGRLLGAAVRALAARADPDLAAWIEAEVPFPCTMVDSITPATTPALRSAVASTLGVQDAWPVQREACVQWVVEEHRALESPEWEAVGVTVTRDVAGHEQAKLRLLNGAHSTLAYVGLLRGHETVAEAMDDAALSAIVRRFMLEDVAATLSPVAGLDVPAYVAGVLRRFANGAIRHELAQIAWDGSKKLPVRILGTVRDARRLGRPLDRLCLPIAAWMHFVRRQSAAGAAIVDPLGESLASLAHDCTNGDAAGDVAAFLDLQEVFSGDLAADPVFRDSLQRVYCRLADGGAQLI
jgi:fructuronate reductase